MRSRNVAFSAAGATPPVYVEDVFSTYLYTGTGSSQTITNNIDLSTNGGMVWAKGRSATSNHTLFDTARGVGKLLRAQLTAGEVTDSTTLTSFNTNGFSVGTDVTTYGPNISGYTYASWTFRKQAKFFDVVTWTGNGTNDRQISHNLGSTPGMIIVKCVSNGGSDIESWFVWHRSLTLSNNELALNSTRAQMTNDLFSSSGQSSSTINFGTSSSMYVNANGRTYVAYLFAHDAGGFGNSGSDSIVKCGSFSATGTTTNTINLGWEPQFIIAKCTSTTSDWFVWDNTRDFRSGVSSGDYQYNSYIIPNSASAETNYVSATHVAGPTETGFSFWPNQSATYIYMAIRRGPMKAPTDATKVFSVTKTDSATVGSAVTTNFPVDMVITGMRSGSGMPQYVEDRIRGVHTTALYNDVGSYPYQSTASAGADTNQTWGLKQAFNMTGFSLRALGSLSEVFWSFRRSAGFFDIVCYKGFGTNSGAYSNISHSLGVSPELVIVKARTDVTSLGGAGGWHVLHTGVNKEFLYLNSSSAGSTPYFIQSANSTTFRVVDHPNTGYSNQSYVSYLFASCPGVSKVGSYTGTGTTKQIECGFTNGARFVMIKRTDSTGDWNVWDSARGIIAGNDPYLPLNVGAAETTNTDYIDPYSAGFELSSTAPDALNANGGTYIFLAIA